MFEFCGITPSFLRKKLEFPRSLTKLSEFPAFAIQIHEKTQINNSLLIYCCFPVSQLAQLTTDSEYSLPHSKSFLSIQNSLITSNKFHFTRTIIATQDQLEQFESGFFDENPYGIVTFEASAHDDVLSLPARFANMKYGSLIFNDNNKNTVQLMPLFSGLEAHFFYGKSLTVGLPTTYERYYVTFTDAVTVTEDDIDTILSWYKAKMIIARGGDDIAYELMLRIDDLSKLRALETLELSVQRLTHVKLQVAPFLEALPELKTIKFDVSALTPEEKKEFVLNQGELQPTSVEGNTVVYKN